MITMLKKELRLTSSVLSYVFIAFSLMTLIPQYPILVGAFFICFGIFHTFQRARESNDILYSVLLPVKKTDIVKGKYLFTILIQSIGFILIVIFTVVRLSVLNKIEPYSLNNMMNANIAYLGYVLIVFACFNMFFVGGFFKTAYKVGIPFIKFGIATLLTIFIGEFIRYIPHLDILNDNFHWSHLIVLFIGIAIYSIGTVWSLKKSQKNFEKIDL